jgi:tetratricopeptide (TPR) repeat protein
MIGSAGQEVRFGKASRSEQEGEINRRVADADAEARVVHDPALMTRAIFTSLLLFGLACNATAQPAVDTSGAGWNECTKAPTRACVLRLAAEAARTIGDPHSAVDALSRIAEAQSEAGLSAEAAAAADQALQFAKSIADKTGYFRDDAIKTIAKVRAKAGKLTDVLDAVGSITDRYVQAQALGAIAVAEGKAGRLDEALRRLQTIEDLRYRALIMRRVAWDLRAGAVARGEDDKIVAALADVQAIDQQYPPPRIMTGVHHSSEYIPALAIIAQAQARAGKITDEVGHGLMGARPGVCDDCCRAGPGRRGRVGTECGALGRRPKGAWRGARAHT